MFVRVFSFILFLTISLACKAESVLIVGGDLWSVSGYARYLPDYSIEDFKYNNIWLSVKGSTSVGILKLAGAARFDQNDKLRVDVAEVAMPFSPNSGARVGILPYRVGWCRAYDRVNPWISEPDAFCRFKGLNEMASSSAGMQFYHSSRPFGWAVDSLIGFYRPQIDGQSDKLGPYERVGPDSEHRKFGVGINAVNVETGSQLKWAWLNTFQDQDSESGGYQRQMRYNTVFFAAEFSLFQATDLKFTKSVYRGSQINPANLYSWKGSSDSVEVLHRITPRLTGAVGLSRYLNRTAYPGKPITQMVDAPGVSASLRYDFDNTSYVVLQYSKADDYAVSRTGAITDRQGEAIGLRMAKTF